MFYCKVVYNIFVTADYSLHRESLQSFLYVLEIHTPVSVSAVRSYECDASVLHVLHNSIHYSKTNAAHACMHAVFVIIKPHSFYNNDELKVLR